MKAIRQFNYIRNAFAFIMCEILVKPFRLRHMCDQNYWPSFRQALQILTQVYNLRRMEHKLP